jgi:hypothetical protein
MRRDAFVWFHGFTELNFPHHSLSPPIHSAFSKNFCTKLSTRGCRHVLGSQFCPIEILRPGRHRVGQARRDKNIKIMGLFAPIQLL